MKNKTIAIILCCMGFVGIGGLHDFYLGRTGWGIVKLLTANFLMIGTVIDLINLFKNKYSYYFAVSNENSEIVNKIVENAKSNRKSIQWYEGTEKQIEWAERLVQNFVKEMNDLISEKCENGTITEDEGIKLKEAIEEGIVKKDEASYWIDSRNDSFKKKAYEILDFEEEAKNIFRKMAQ